MHSLKRGDTWIFEYQVLDYDNNPIDVRDWEIRAEISKGEESLKKANDKVTGGHDSQIEVLDSEGNIKITFQKEDTDDLEISIYKLEVEITSIEDIYGNKHRFTIISETIKVIEDIIQWEDIE